MPRFPTLPLVLLSTVVGSAALDLSAFAQSDVEITVPASQHYLCLAVETAASGQSGVLVSLDDRELRIPAQLVPAVATDGTQAAERLLLAQIPPSGQVDQPQRFRWEAVGENAQDAEEIARALRWIDENDASIKVMEEDRPVLVYNHGDIICDRLPENDERRRRSCYIHPLWGINGEVLTDDFPADHVHHHGAFWTWPHVEIDGQHYDLWVSQGIRQRFIKWLYRGAGPVAAVVGVENGWFVGDRQVMTERIWIRAYRASETERAIDLELVFSPTDRPVRLVGSPGKSYGGLTVRFDVWPRRDAVVRVPDRTVRHVGTGLASSEDLSNTRLPWASLSSHFAEAPHRSAGSVFIPPDHPDFPPTWLTRCYGPLCVGWPGVEGREFQPGESFTLRYRLLLHKTEVEHQQLEQAYSAYCQSQEIKAE
jgi:hypothetical protein